MKHVGYNVCISVVSDHTNTLHVYLALLTVYYTITVYLEYAWYVRIMINISIAQGGKFVTMLWISTLVVYI